MSTRYLSWKAKRLILCHNANSTLPLGRTAASRCTSRVTRARAALEAVKLFEQIVGEIQSEQKTSEFYEPEEQVQFRIDQRL